MASLNEAVNTLQFFQGIKDKKIRRAERAEAQRIALHQWTFGQLTDQYRNATGAQRKHIAESMKSLFSLTEPSIKQALLPYLKGGPLDPVQEKLNQFDSFMSAPKITASADENPTLYGNQLFAVKRHQQIRNSFAGLPTTKEIDPYLFSNSKGDNYMAVPDEHGVKVFAFDDAEFERIGGEYNITGAALKAQGGWVKTGERFHYHLDGTYKYTSYKNVITGGYDQRVGKVNNYAPGGGADRGDKHPRQQPESLRKALKAMEVGGDALKSDVEAQALNQFMEGVQEQVEDIKGPDQARYDLMSAELDRYMATSYPGWNFRILDPNATFWKLGPIGNYYRKGDKWALAAAPGEKMLLNLGEDYGSVPVIYDGKDGREDFYLYTLDANEPFGLYLGNRETTIFRLRQRLDALRRKATKAPEPEARPTPFSELSPEAQHKRRLDLLDIQGD